MIKDWSELPTMQPSRVEFMTARQLQELLQVDRSTIYRMAERGRVPALKVGGQWRFPSRQIEAWLQQDGVRSESATPTAGGKAMPTDAVALRKALPLVCVQLIQDTFAHVLGVGLVITDIEGKPVTQPSNVCDLYRFAVEQNPAAQSRHWATYAEMARRPGIQPVYGPGFLGLLCARGMVSLHGENVAMVIANGIAPSPWPPAPQAVTEMAGMLGIDASTLAPALENVFYLDARDEVTALDSIQRIADIVAHVMQERSQFQATLQNIAELTKI